MARKKKRHEVVSNAPGVGFQKVHPTESAGQTNRGGPDLPPSGPDDGIDSKIIRCKQCGFPLIDKTETTKGDEWGGNINTQEAYYHFKDDTSFGVTTDGSSWSSSSTAPFGTFTESSSTTTLTSIYALVKVDYDSTGTFVGYVHTYSSALPAETEGTGAATSETVTIVNSEDTNDTGDAIVRWIRLPLKTVYSISSGTKYGVAVESASTGAYVAYSSTTGVESYTTTASSWSSTTTESYSIFGSNLDYEPPATFTEMLKLDSTVKGGCPLCGSSEYE